MSKAFFSKQLVRTVTEDREQKADQDLVKKIMNYSTAEARKVIPYDLALHYRIFPINVSHKDGYDYISYCTAYGPNLIDVESAIEFCTGMRVNKVFMSQDAIDEAIFRAYHGDEQALESKAIKARETVTQDLPSIEEKEPVTESEIAEFLRGIIAYAVAHEASDIHFIPLANGAILRLRVNGILRENKDAINSKKFLKQLVLRIKVLAKLPIEQSVMPLDGDFKTTVEGREFAIRVSIMQTVNGEKVVLRILGNSATLHNVELPVRIAINLNEQLAHQHGAIIFSGPTGSGKSTTIYSILNRLKDLSLNIVTVEDPVELEMPGITQTSIAEKQGLTYDICLKAILRQDPDVVMVGEIRDSKTAHEALQAALTGHLVLSTIHARSVLDLILRLSHFGLDNALIAQSICLLIFQRLTPKLCQKCRVIDLKSSNLTGFDIYQKVGCYNCDYSGYDGRVLIAEALIIDDDIRAAISSGIISANELKNVITDKNYIPLSLSLLEQLKAGNISMADYKRLL